MLCVEFPKVQYIDLSEIIHVLKALTIVTSEHLTDLSMIFVVSPFLNAVLCPRVEVKPGFRTQKKCPFAPKFDRAFEVYFLGLP